MKKISGYAIIEIAIIAKQRKWGVFLKHIVTINKANLKATAEKGGCGKCQSSCQSACKTSCTVANQKCASKS